MKIKLSKHQNWIIKEMQKGIELQYLFMHIKTVIILKKHELIDKNGDLTEDGASYDTGL